MPKIGHATLTRPVLNTLQLRCAVLDYLDASPLPLKALEIASGLNQPAEPVKAAIEALLKTGEVVSRKVPYKNNPKQTTTEYSSVREEE